MADNIRDDSKELKAWKYAVRSQGYTGTYADWLQLSDDDRAEYETGAQGVGTV